MFDRLRPDPRELVEEDAHAAEDESDDEEDDHEGDLEALSEHGRLAAAAGISVSVGSLRPVRTSSTIDRYQSA